MFDVGIEPVWIGGRTFRSMISLLLASTSFFKGSSFLGASVGEASVSAVSVVSAAVE